MNRTTALAFASLAFSATAFAGPLNPPVGPVTSTMKTMTEIEPRIAINQTNTPGDNDATPSLFKITQPGSYYLTGNITGVAGKHGIEIAANGVTIDLNGFSVAGTTGMGAFDGIISSVSNLRETVVRNGSVTGWGRMGINLGNVPVDGSVITGMIVSRNQDIGISTGNRTIMTDCVISDNTAAGVVLGVSSNMEGCVISGNDGVGVFANEACIITRCTARNNGFDGFTLINACAISNCTAVMNGNDGIQATSACRIINNNCDLNGTNSIGAGVHVTGNDNRIEGNVCTFGDRGIDIDFAGNIIIKNSCSGAAINWEIVAGNAYGPIVATPAGAAVNGNTAPAALGSTDPNANFTY